jgi:subtilisin family serine protease
LLSGVLLLLVAVAAQAQTNLSYVTLTHAELVKHGLAASARAPLKRPGRKVPPVTHFSKLRASDLALNAVALTEAETLAGQNFFEGRFGHVETPGGSRLFNREVVLVKFRNAAHVAALRVEPLRELDAIQTLRQRDDVEFAELDSFESRQLQPNDPLVSSQWHHQVIGSFDAWSYSLGDPSIRIAIVDTPFQMDHPDLAAHADPGWDVVDGVTIQSSTGIDHSTIAAGLAAAVIGNGTGIAGASNCRVLPINIDGAISEMYDAVIWAADHGVRVVNISWTGADSDTLNSAGAYLKTKARGILAMPGVNGSGFLDYTNQPDIYCISMTDAADNMRSRFGNHIDFAAPGWEIFSTTTNSTYVTGTGTSYATPLFCGVVATLFSINPALGPDDVIEILKSTAVDLGSPGWDQFYGYGRINFAGAAAAANASRPVIANLQIANGSAVMTVANPRQFALKLLKTSEIGSLKWDSVVNAISSTNADVVTLTDPAPDALINFYRVEAQAR